MVVGARFFITLTALAVTTLPSAAADGERRKVRLGGITVGANYVRGPAWWGPGMWGGPWGPGWVGGPAAMWGPGWWRPWGPAWWDPFWYGGWAHPGFWGGFAQGPGMGEVKLASAPPEAMVFVDGGYAGSVSKLKNMWLEPGIYNLEVRDDDGATWSKKIYVLSGKTLQLRPVLHAKAEEQK